MIRRLNPKGYERGKVLPFEQTGDFYHRRGSKRLDNSEYLEALAYYRRAVEKEPTNVEYHLAMAEVYTVMNYFEESNKILLVLMTGGESFTTECYFGMGCNYIGLQEYDKALESFRRYIQTDPDGEFSDEVYDVLDVLQEPDLFREAFGDTMALERTAAYQSAAKGKRLLDLGETGKAIKMLEKVVEKNPDLFFVRNNLALAYYVNRQMDKAVQTAQAVLSDEPNDLLAKCNLALFYFDKGEHEHAAPYIDMLKTAQTDDPEELSRLSMTLLELGLHEGACAHIKKLLKERPYDQKTLHQYGVCLYHLGRYRMAEDAWGRILRIEPHNTIAQYYINEARRVNEGGTPQKELHAHFQVPYEELLRRIQYLNRCVKLPHEKALELWQSGDELYDTLLWGLELTDNTIKRAMLSFAAGIGGEKSEKLLRDFILRRNHPDEIKREAFAMLKRMGAGEPYIAYMGKNIVEVRVNIFEGYGEELPKEYKQAIEIAIRMIREIHGDECVRLAISIWEKFVAKQKKGYAQIRSAHSWAAALEYIACKQLGIKVSKAQLCYRYETSIARVNSAYNKLEAALKDSE